jgi:LTXXQ motif family protein
MESSMQIFPMRRMTFVALPALLGSALVLGVVHAQTPPQPGAPVLPPPHFHHDGGRWGAAPGLRLADRFATLEIYLGITPQQQDAWRAFTQAALAMVPNPEEMHRDMAGGAFDGIEHMTARLQHMAEAAQKLEQAAQTLKAVLTPEQIQKADAAWATLHAMHEQGRHHGMHRHHDDGHDDD